MSSAWLFGTAAPAPRRAASRFAVGDGGSSHAAGGVAGRSPLVAAGSPAGAGGLRAGFGEIAKRGEARADGALYWKAYAQNKRGQRDEALATLEELRKSFPSSPWLNDAKALEVEVRQAAGRPVSPETETDDDLKLMAINSLVHSDPERAVPLLEKLLKGSHSPKLKERALFVLNQSGSPRAREVVAEIARKETDPAMKKEAVHKLSAMKSKEATDFMIELLNK